MGHGKTGDEATHGVGDEIAFERRVFVKGVLQRTSEFFRTLLDLADVSRAENAQDDAALVQQGGQLVAKIRIAVPGSGDEAKRPFRVRGRGGYESGKESEEERY